VAKTISPLDVPSVASQQEYDGSCWEAAENQRSAPRRRVLPPSPRSQLGSISANQQNLKPAHREFEARGVVDDKFDVLKECERLKASVVVRRAEKARFTVVH
jgi:hypothetical protein